MWDDEIRPTEMQIDVEKLGMVSEASSDAERVLDADDIIIPNVNGTDHTLANTSVTERPGPSLASSEHLSTGRQYWRDIILGVNDGIISTFLLVTGVSGGGLTSIDILLTAIAGALAGAVSMFAGEFMATKSQNEVMSGEVTLEKVHIEKYMDDEIEEMRGLLDIIGIPEEGDTLSAEILQFYRAHPQSLLKAMTALEFGVLDVDRRTPMCAGLTSGCLFLTGALPSVLPFTFSGDRPLFGLLWAGIFTTVSLLLVGVAKTWATRGSWWKSSAENLLIASLGGGMAYAVGLLFDSLLRE